MGTNLGENIRKARKALKLSQEALGELTGANRVTISKYENNEYNPSIPALKRLAEALHTTPGELTGDDAYTKKEPAISDGLDAEFSARVGRLNPANREKMLAYLDGLLDSQAEQAP